MSRHIFSLAETQAGGRLSGAESKKLKLGIFSLTPEQQLAASRKGGITQGNIQGAKNRDSGQLDRIRELPQTKLAQSVAGKINGKATGLKYGPLVDMSRVRTKAGCKLGAARGGPLSRCKRWHENRGYFSLKCRVCQERLAATWGISLMDKEFRD
jgi:hypothetical protein